MKNSNFYNRGQSLLGIIIVLVTVGLITGGLYFYLSKQIPEVSEITKKAVEEKIVEPEEKPTTAPEITCQNECSPLQLTKCVGKDFQVCGYYDKDNCLEWGPVINCPVNTTCQNRSCVQATAPSTPEPEKPAVQKCADGTLYNQCSTNKPKYCTNGNLIDKCSTCGCSSNQNCTASGECQISQALVSGGIVCNSIYYKGINIGCYDNKFYEGYDEQLCKNDSECPANMPKCFNHKCAMNHPYYYLKIDIETPISVSINTDFKVKINIENTHPTEKLDLIIDNLLFYRFIQYPLVNKAGGGLSPSSDSRNPGETSFTIKPGERKNFEFIFNSKSSITFNAGIYLWIHEPGYSGEIQSQPIIVYDPSKSYSMCGEITYNIQYATCINNILYIAGSNKCNSNADCTSGTCYQHYCVNPLGTALTTKPKGNYKAGLMILYLSDDSNERKEQESRKNLQETVSGANEWFRKEISNWNVQDFNITYEKLDCTGMTYSSFLNIAKNNKSRGGIAVFEDVAKYCNIDRQKYKILGFNWEFGQSQNSKPLVDALDAAGIYFGASGVYYGSGIFTTAMGGSNSFSFPVHETMHAFGLLDLYMSYDGNYISDAGSEYIWRNCYLMSGKNAKYFSSEHIPLCKLEAYQLDWTE